MQPLRIIFAGAGEFGIPTLRAMRDARHEIVRVMTQPDRPAGRGRTMTPTPVALAAEELGLDVIRTGDINKETLPPADVMVVIAFGQKIADAQVHHPRLGSVNLHSSRLPRHRGAAPINWAILSGDTTTGNSIIRLAQRMDAGPVLAMSELTIGDVETAGELHDRLSLDGAPLMLKLLEDLAAGCATETPQDESRATVAPKLSRETAILDWTRPAAEVARKIRGLSPWPGCRVRLCDAQGTTIASLRFIRARATESGETDRWSVGEIMSDGVVRAGDGGVEIIDVQPDGRTPMPLTDYRRGHRWQAGMQLTPA